MIIDQLEYSKDIKTEFMSYSIFLVVSKMCVASKNQPYMGVLMRTCFLNGTSIVIHESMGYVLHRGFK